MPSHLEERGPARPARQVPCCSDLLPGLIPPLTGLSLSQVVSESQRFRLRKGSPLVSLPVLENRLEEGQSAQYYPRRETKGQRDEGSHFRSHGVSVTETQRRDVSFRLCRAAPGSNGPLPREEVL